MKNNVFYFVLASTFIIASCFGKSENCALNCNVCEPSYSTSNFCSEHPETETHQNCYKAKNCKQHTSCMVYKQYNAY